MPQQLVIIFIFRNIFRRLFTFFISIPLDKYNIL
jgi:hypothetical protein